MGKSDDFDLQAFLPYQLAQAAEAASLSFQQIYKQRYGLLRTDWRVLFHLGQHGCMTAKEIAICARTHKTKISRAVRRLEERRLLTRTRDVRDRRSEHLELTAAGLAAHRELREIAEVYEARLTAPFTAGEVAQLRAMLQRLAKQE